VCGEAGSARASATRRRRWALGTAAGWRVRNRTGHPGDKQIAARKCRKNEIADAGQPMHLPRAVTSIA